mmetsp:Transcript_41613/g.103554  ORF Transcript_41613/g.103554 Transcript_41613/m.103554 type:complete len:92 (-) Transcript_41613:302-577(-)
MDPLDPRSHPPACPLLRHNTHGCQLRSFCVRSAKRAPHPTPQSILSAQDRLTYISTYAAGVTTVAGSGTYDVCESSNLYQHRESEFFANAV